MPTEMVSNVFWMYTVLVGSCFLLVLDVCIVDVCTEEEFYYHAANMPTEA
jgi:hypothetical protein